MSFTKVQPYGPTAYTYWISGIYKIVSYRKGEYSAYFIQELARNWGDHVCKPPHNPPARLYSNHGNCWNTLKSAKADCEQHAKQYQPSKAIANRAIDILNAYQTQEATNV